jgi:dihydrofolate reductase
VARNGVIGKDGRLPWHLPADLKRFKALTMGHHLLVGRKTWEAIGRPLPGRVMVVITRQEGYEAPGATVVHSFDEALEVARRAGDPEPFVAGGGEIYTQAMPKARRIYLTEVDAEVEGDTRFPPFDRRAWELVERQAHRPDAENPLGFRFLVYKRR